jgi:GWxTD domain-containing protein
MLRRFTYNAIEIVTAVIIMSLGYSCATTQKTPVDTKDMSYIYNPAKNVFTPDIALYNEDAETTVLAIGIRKNEFFFSEANPESVPMATVLVSVRLFDNTIGGVLADTSTFKYDIRRDDIRGEYVFHVPLKTYEGKEYTADIKVIDLIRQRAVQTFAEFERTGPYSRLNYRIRDYFGHTEMLSNVVRRDEYINILAPSLQPDTLWLFYYKAVKELPAPPSTVLPEVTLPMMFPREGIYLFSPDSLIREGLVLCNFGTDHPSMTSPEAMIPMLEYIATPDEMDTLMTAAKPKLALDNFWLARTGSIERSKELIRIYYNRALFSNYYFSSYKAGWLTDRGMMYIMYGPPDKVYKNTEGESWGYKLPPVKSRWGSGYTVQDEYLWFNFRRQKSVFSDNDYILNRAATPLSYWDIAVARWREGKVFRLDNPDELK